MFGELLIFVRRTDSFLSWESRLPSQPSNCLVARLIASGMVRTTRIGQSAGKASIHMCGGSLNDRTAIGSMITRIIMGLKIQSSPYLKGKVATVPVL